MYFDPLSTVKNKFSSNQWSLVNTLLVLLFCVLAIASTAQTVEFEYIEQGYSENCISDSDCSINQLCYAIKYTPSVTGNITSYTLGFIGDCNSNSMPYVSSQSCVMNDNSNATDACSSGSAFAVVSSGNSGNLSVTAGLPVLIHSVCFDFTDQDAINLVEDEITGLTISIDSIGNNNPITDFPTFEGAPLNYENCGCQIELQSQSSTLNQVVNCLSQADSIIYHINLDAQASVSGLPKGMNFSLENKHLNIYGVPRELGIFDVDINISEPCDSSWVIPIEIQQPAVIMNGNNCYDDISMALDEVMVGDTIRILSNYQSNLNTHIELPSDIFLKLESNTMWSIK